MKEEILLEKSTLSSGSVHFTLDGADSFLVRGVVRDGTVVATGNLLLDGGLVGGFPIFVGSSVIVLIDFDPFQGDRGTFVESSIRSDAARPIAVSESFSVISGVPSQATASVSITTDTVSDLDGATIQIISSDGTSKTYRFDDDNTDGFTGDVHPDGVVVVQINGLTNRGKIGTMLKLAIEGETGHGYKIVVNGNGGNLTLFQQLAGTAGNTLISTVGISGATISSSFSGGIDGGVAKSTFTFNDKPDEGSTCTLKDTKGVSKTFEIDNEANGVSGSNIAVNNIAASGGGAKGTATDLVAKINAQSSFNIIATNPDDGVVNLSQGSADSAAKATFRLNDKPDEGSTVEFVDSDGVAVTFEVDNENDGVAGSNVALNNIYAEGGGGGGTADDLVVKINLQSSLDIVAGLGSTVERSLSTGGIVSLTQGSVGSAGNTTITLDDRAHWDSVCTVNVPTAFTGGTDGSAFHTATAIAAAINDVSTGSSLVTASVSDNTVTLVSKITGEHGNRISCGIVNFDGAVVKNSKFLSGGISTFPSGGSTATALFDVFARLTSLDEDDGTSLTGTRSAETDALISFFDTKCYGRITFAWSGLAVGDDVTLYFKSCD